jgi:hypothetical protein
MTTDQQRCSAVEAFGYTPRQAQFLVRVALHGGYFLRRQYLAFTGRAHGQAMVRFLSRAIERCHVRPLSFGRLGHVYHLYARPIYAAIGEENNRNRRTVETASVIRKIMTVDFVMAMPDATFLAFLATEEEKVALLDQLRVWQELWPAKHYKSRRRNKPDVTRYFVDKMPWLRLPDDPRVWFVYVDAEGTLSGFETFVMQYGRVFKVVACGVIYVGTSAWLGAVQRSMTKAVTRLAHLPSFDEGKFVRYCRIRQAIDTNRFAGIDMDEVMQLRYLKEDFKRAAFDDLYARWLDGGTEAVTTAIGIQMPRLTCELRVHRLGFRYDFNRARPRRTAAMISGDAVPERRCHLPRHRKFLAVEEL